MADEEITDQTDAPKVEESTAKSRPARKTKTQGVVDEWPLSGDHYFSTPNLSPRSHSDEGRYVRQIQQEVAVEETGVFGDDTREGVVRWQEENDVPVTGVVNADVWKAMRSAR